MKESSFGAILSGIATAVVTYTAMHGESGPASSSATFAVIWALLSIKAAIKEKN
jgi:hypothetical protein